LFAGIVLCEHESQRGWREDVTMLAAELMDTIGAAIQGIMVEWSVAVSVFVIELVDTSGMVGRGISTGGDDIIRTLKFLAKMRKH